MSGELQADLAYFRDRVHALEVAVRGARAVLAVADDAPRRTGVGTTVPSGGIAPTGVDPDAAASLLRALLAVPDERPESVEAGHVTALEDILRAVLAHLDPAGGQ